MPMHSAEECFCEGRQAQEARRLKEAHAWFRACLAIEPNHGAAWHLLGKLEAESGDLPGGLASQQRSCRLHPELGWNWFAAAELQQRLGNWSAAARDYEEASRRLPGERWIPRLAKLARERFWLGGECLSDGLGRESYHYWLRQLEPSLPPSWKQLRHPWWQPLPSGSWRRLGPDLHRSPCHFQEVDGTPWPCGGGWMLLVSRDCVLRPGALAAFEEHLTALETRAADLLYCDEDLLDNSYQRCDPWFKPDWVPESFWSTPWLETCSVWSMEWLRSQELDIPPMDPVARWEWQLEALRRGPAIIHVGRILVHRRTVKNRLEETGVEESLQRAKILHRHLASHGEGPVSVAPCAPASPSFQLRWSLPSHPRVRVVIPTHDHGHMLDCCLTALEATARHLALDVVVIDHQSRQPATRQVLNRWHQKLGSRFHVVREEGAFNWSLFNNHGSRGWEGNLLLFMNNDVEASHDRWVETLAAHALRREVGCVAPILYYPNGTLQHAGVVVGFRRGCSEHAYRGLSPDHSVHRGRSRYLTGWGAVTGACLMVRRQQFEAVGGFDVRFPVEYNDVEFCLRLGALGLRHVVVPEAQLLHHECQSRDPATSPTAEPALGLLQTLYPQAVRDPLPWWPPACSSTHTDGRPNEMAGFG